MDDLNFSMNIGDGVQKVRPDGRGLSPFYYKRSKKKANPKLRNFRLGEIIQGKIIKITDIGVGLVRLPNGEFTCHLHQKLLAGDELFFKIAEVNPSLVLKVHSVQSIIAGRRRLTDDIVRILDLPDEDLYIYTSDLFLTFKHIIYKDDLLRFYKFYSKVPRNIDYDVESFSRTLFWLSESGLAFEYDIFISVYNYFSGLKNKDEQFNNLFIKYYKNFPEKITKLISPFRQKYYDGLGKDNLLFNYFALNQDNSEFCFYKLISKLAHTEISQNVDRIPDDITDFIESMHLWNNICTDSDSAYHWTFPFRNIDRIYLITLVFRSQFNINSIKVKLSGELPNQDIDVGSVLNQLFELYEDDFIDEIMQVSNFEFLTDLIARYFSKFGLTLMALHYYDGNLRTIESSSGSVLPNNKSISFVI